MKGILLVFILVGSVAAFRPLSVDDAPTVPTGAFELEAGFDALFHDPLEKGLCFCIAQGLTGRMDIGLFMPVSLGTYSDVYAIELGLKYALLQGNGSQPQISFSLANVLGENSASLNLILSQSLGHVSYHANIGYEAAGHRVFSGGIAAEFTLSDKFVPVAEVFIESDKYFSENMPLSVMTGFYAPLKEWMALDAGLKYNFHKSHECLSVTLGTTFAY